MRKVLGRHERAKLALLVGKEVQFKARNVGSTWEDAFLHTLHLNKDGDWVTLKYRSGEATGGADDWMIRLKKLT